MARRKSKQMSKKNQLINDIKELNKKFNKQFKDFKSLQRKQKNLLKKVK